MGNQRVLLLSGQSLLGESLQAILSREVGVELIGPWPPDAEVLDRLPGARADVVLVADEDGGVVAARILEGYPNLPLVRIGLNENVVRIYTASTLPARSSDLLAALRNLAARGSAHV